MNLIQMAGTRSMHKQGSLALATSLIHRSRSLEELRKAFFFIAPKFVHGHAYGMYLLDEQLNAQTVFYSHTNLGFLNEYENIRDSDPMFKCLLQRQKFTHSLEIFDLQKWLEQPLHDCLSHWGLDFSIQAPLVVDGQVKGTLNIARGGKRYFEADCLISASFLCSEMDAAFKRIHEMEALKKALALHQVAPDIRVCISRREQEVLELAVNGLSNRVIAGRLAISENTVRHHLKRIYQAFCVHNRAQLVQRVYSGNSPAMLN
ncbi:MAG TPA: helix-turn-helix transcriptional regulator [Xanthomonadales bacterium]|nr:helix-turn-helix transcriptional regulator [Xanthomonadales bacterium]